MDIPEGFREYCVLFPRKRRLILASIIVRYCKAYHGRDAKLAKFIHSSKSEHVSTQLYISILALLNPNERGTRIAIKPHGFTSLNSNHEHSGSWDATLETYRKPTNHNCLRGRISLECSYRRQSRSRLRGSSKFHNAGNPNFHAKEWPTAESRNKG